MKINVQSEIGRLDAVLLHRPGAEVENMTPRNVQRALYSDILNLSIAQSEYSRLHGVLSKVSKVYEVADLLEKVLDRPQSRERLLRRICESEDAMQYIDFLADMDTRELARVLIEGLPARVDTLTSYLRNEYYALYPLYNFYFTRDAAVTIGNSALVCRMANKVRMREALIMDAIYRDCGEFECQVTDANECAVGSPVIMEGGDIIVAREDLLIVGNGVRTSSQGIDFMVDQIRRKYPSGRYHVIVQQLPSTPESFIHLDMVFTMLDVDKCMIFKPLIQDANQWQTVHVTIDDSKVSSIRPVDGLITAVKGLGLDLEPVICGGDDDWDQEREQWHSGANSFAFAPGKIITYARNIHTVEALSQSGFEILNADDVIAGRHDELICNDRGKCAVLIEGSELPRGGGGPRCMTMPLSRQNVSFLK